MSIQICTNNGINLDNQRVEFSDTDGYKHGLFVTQRREGTIVYSASFMGGLGYKEYPMPHARYSLLVEGTAFSGNPGLMQFEADIRALLAGMQA